MNESLQKWFPSDLTLFRSKSLHKESLQKWFPLNMDVSRNESLHIYDVFRSESLLIWIYLEMNPFRYYSLEKGIPSDMNLSRNESLQIWIYLEVNPFRYECVLKWIPLDMNVFRSDSLLIRSLEKAIPSDMNLFRNESLQKRMNFEENPFRTTLDADSKSSIKEG